MRGPPEPNTPAGTSIGPAYGVCFKHRSRFHGLTIDINIFDDFVDELVDG